MKNTVVRFGLFAATSICVLFLLSWFLGKSLSSETQEIVGYASIMVSLLFVFLGIKHFRDKENQGLISFKNGFIVGIFISLFAALAFGLLDLIYVHYLNPDFVDTYYAEAFDKANSTLTGSELSTKLKALTADKESFKNPMISFFFMFILVFMMGAVTTIISALILQRKQK